MRNLFGLTDRQLEIMFRVAMIAFKAMLFIICVAVVVLATFLVMDVMSPIYDGRPIATTPNWCISGK